jgi:hypothetical protein
LSEDNLLLTGNLGQLPCNDVQSKKYLICFQTLVYFTV